MATIVILPIKFGSKPVKIGYNKWGKLMITILHTYLKNDLFHELIFKP